MTAAKRLLTLRLAGAALRSTGHADDARQAAAIADLANALEDGFRRDAAICDLAAQFDGPLWTIAGHVAAALRRYAGSDWKARDRRLTAPRDAYLSQPVKRACFYALRAANGKVIGQKQVARILASHCSDWSFDGHESVLPMSTGFIDAANRTTDEVNLERPFANADH